MKANTDIYVIPSISFDGNYELIVSRGEKKLKILCASQEEAFTTLEERAKEIDYLLEA